MYYINKIVGWILSPMGILFLGMAVGLLLRHLRGKGTKLHAVGTVVIALSLAQLWVFGCGITTRLVGTPLEKAYSVEGRVHGDVAGLPAADAIVLLGGGMGVHAKCGAAELFGGADRVWTAARLWKVQMRTAGAGTKSLPITVSGGGAKAESLLLQDFGVAKDCIQMFEEARNTEEEAKLIAAMGVKKILLVTSAWHMPRARMLFEHAGFEVVPAPCDFEMHFMAEEPVQVRDFFPSGDCLARNSWCVKEWVARFFYWIKYR